MARKLTPAEVRYRIGGTLYAIGFEQGLTISRHSAKFGPYGSPRAQGHTFISDCDCDCGQKYNRMLEVVERLQRYPC